jgi:hypothetical protein
MMSVEVLGGPQCRGGARPRRQLRAATTTSDSVWVNLLARVPRVATSGSQAVRCDDGVEMSQHGVGACDELGEVASDHSPRLGRRGTVGHDPEHEHNGKDAEDLRPDVGCGASVEVKASGVLSAGGVPGQSCEMAGTTCFPSNHTNCTGSPWSGMTCTSCTPTSASACISSTKAAAPFGPSVTAPL